MKILILKISENSHIPNLLTQQNEDSHSQSGMQPEFSIFPTKWRFSFSKWHTTWIPDIPNGMKILILKVAYNLNSWISSKQE